MTITQVTIRHFIGDDGTKHRMCDYYLLRPDKNCNELANFEVFEDPINLRYFCKEHFLDVLEDGTVYYALLEVITEPVE